MTTKVVLDASAVLATLLGEPGGDFVDRALGEASIAAVNYAEALAAMIELGSPAILAAAALDRLGCDVVAADKDRALLVGEMHALTRRTGVSLGDRFCLQLARELGAPVLTSDRRWKELDLGVEVILIR